MEEFSAFLRKVILGEKSLKSGLHKVFVKISTRHLTWLTKGDIL